VIVFYNNQVLHSDTSNLYASQHLVTVTSDGNPTLFYDTAKLPAADVKSIGMTDHEEKKFRKTITSANREFNNYLMKIAAINSKDQGAALLKVKGHDELYSSTTMSGKG
jgi:hypothetical protein